MNVQPIPSGCEAPIPYLVVRGAAKAIEFYKQPFGATELTRMSPAGGSAVMHAEIKIRNSVLMLADENPKMNYLAPQANQTPPVSIMLYVPDVDAWYDRAVRAGGQPTLPPTDHAYGDRGAGVTDEWGNFWYMATPLPSPNE